VTEPIRPEDLRVSDAERQAVQDRLREAQSVGQLDIHEFDDRVQSAWASRTRGELERVVADLPVLPPTSTAQPARRPAHQVFSDTGGGTAMRILTIIWLGVVTVNLIVWGLVSITAAEEIYPWWIWLAPSGAALAVLYAAGIGRPRNS
jgi:Domain of unknown function (DUF1707)